jgi:hypothetical protein
VPFPQGSIDVERTVGKVNAGIGTLKVEAWGELLVVQGQNRLDQAGNPGGVVEMTDIGFDRTERTELLVQVVRISGGGSKRLSQRGDFNRVAEFGARAVGFHIRYGI